MKNKTKIFIFLTVLIIAVISIFAFSDFNKESKYDNFVNCLAEKGVKFYGAFWCPHCKDQKSLFGNSVKLLEENVYIECDAKGKNAQPDKCEENEITGYPTWIFQDGIIAKGKRSLEYLSASSGCELNG